MIDPLGQLLRRTPYFRGKGRLTRWWGRHVPAGSRRVARLPDGSRVAVDLDIPYERQVWLQAEEWGELVYLKSKLRRGDAFVDVGSNLGLWSLVASSAVGPAGAVYSFEPNPTTYDKLRDNVGRNAKGSVVTTFPAAVSDHSGRLPFRCDADHNVSAIAEAMGGAGVVGVPCLSLDDALLGRPRVGRLAGMKLDTEGHELAALRGAAGLLAAFAPWLVVEFNTDLLPSRRLADWPVYGYLAGLGYAAATYDASGRETPAPGGTEVRGYRNILFQRGGAT